MSGKKALYREIYDSLYSAIISGSYGNGGRLPTEYQLAQKYQTSRSTVAKAMRELEFAGVVRRQAGAGSFAVPPANTSNTFASLLIAGLGDIEFFTPISAQIAVSCQKHDISLIFGNAGSAMEISSRPHAESIGRRLVEQRVSGVFFAPNQWNRSDDELLQRSPLENHDLFLAEMLAKAGIVVVLIDRDITLYPQRSAFDFVGIDNLNAAYEQTQHLFAQGCRRIIHLTRPGMLTTKAARIAGYRTALEHLGLPYSRQNIHTGDPEDPVFVRQTLADNPDGVVCFNDPMGTAYLHTLRGLGVRVPQDLKVIGVDDLDYTKFLPVPLSTMRQPRKELGELAVNVLVRRLTDRSLPPSENLLTTPLIVRESTKNEP